ncbi:hypothetical protein ACFGY2_07220 [Pasteurella multocida]|nr:hypothetical protein [Pasteurella multocida]
MEKFNKQKALDGAPVMLRNGCKAFVKFEVENPEFKHSKLCGFFIDKEGKGISILLNWSDKGKFSKLQDPWDIVGMFNDGDTIGNVTIELPRPLKTAERNQRVYLITEKGISSTIYKETANDVLMLEDARFFATREDAQAWDDLAKRVRDM